MGEERRLKELCGRSVRRMTSRQLSMAFMKWYEMSRESRMLLRAAEDEKRREETLALMSPEQRAVMLAAVSDEERAAMMAAMSPEERAAAMAVMSAEQRAAMMHHMPADERLSMMAAMSPEERAAMMAAMSPEDRASNFSLTATSSIRLYSASPHVCGYFVGVPALLRYQTQHNRPLDRCMVSGKLILRSHTLAIDAVTEIDGNLRMVIFGA